MRPTAAANWSYKHICCYFEFFSELFSYFTFLFLTHFAACLYNFSHCCVLSCVKLAGRDLRVIFCLFFWGVFFFIFIPCLLWIFPWRKKEFPLNTTIWLSVKVLIGAFIYSVELNSTVILHRASANPVFFLLKAYAGGVSTGYSVYKSLMKWLWLFSFAHTFELLTATHS